LFSLPRLLGQHQHRIDYRHVIWSLVRKPGAFAQYRYRDDLFPTLTFRQAYDVLCTQHPQRADREYVRLLHLAASTSEADVETALLLLLEQQTTPTFERVRDLVRDPVPPMVPELTPAVLDFALYDRLLVGEGSS
jgi:hypothetical protein